MSLPTKNFTSSSVAATSEGVENFTMNFDLFSINKFKIAPSQSGKAWKAEIYYDAACAGTVCFEIESMTGTFISPRRLEDDGSYAEAGASQLIDYYDAAEAGKLNIRFYNQSDTAMTFTVDVDHNGLPVGKDGNWGFGIATAAAKVHIDQPSATGAIPVLTLDQADVSEEFIRLIGASTTDASQSLIDAADLTTPGTIKGWFKIRVQDAGGSPVMNVDYFVPFYSAPTA